MILEKFVASAVFYCLCIKKKTLSFVPYIHQHCGLQLDLKAVLNIKKRVCKYICKLIKDSLMTFCVFFLVFKFRILL